MWLGIVIASVLGLALLYALFTAVSFARRRRFGAAIAIAVPTCLVGYFFVSLAAPAIWIEVAGDPNLERISDDAVKVPAGDLQALLENRTYEGMYYDDGAWYHYRESYMSSGAIRGKGGPENDPELWSWTGKWKIENGQMCTKYDGDFECGDLYLAGDTYQGTDENGKIVSWLKPVGSVAELDPTAERLLDDQLRSAIDGAVHTGRLMDADQAANFQMAFFDDNHAVYTQRGDNPDQLEQVEYGWYRFDDNQVCLSRTLGTHGDCFSVYELDDTFSFVMDRVRVDMTTSLTP